MRKICLWLLLLLSCIRLSAQNQTIVGKVIDGQGLPVANASVTVKGSPSGTATKADGTYSLSVPTSAKQIEITAVGFNKLTIDLKSSVLKYDATLTLTASEINEVVITGYTTIQRKKFSGATTAVPIGEVRTQPLASFDQALQGQSSGVSVLASSGQPGANAVVRIRGNGSISGGNTPLYIMDGIEITAADFATINQGDFDRVEILKDAVATAMYGSRGANGVIVITTRRGRAGQIQLNYDAQLGFSRLPKDKLIVMNSKEKIDYELQRGNPWGWTAAQADSLRAVNFSWKDALFRTGVTHQHMLSASGGSAASRFFASLAYLDQEGIVKTTGLKRYTARINVDNTIKNWRFGMNLQGGYSKSTATSEGNTVISSPLNAIRWGNPYERDINPNTGEYQETGGAGTGRLTSAQPNAAMELFLNYNYAQQIKGVGTAYLEFQFPFLKGLAARTNWGVDYSQTESTTFTSPKTSTGIARQGALSRGLSRTFRYTGTTSLNYKKDFGKHEIEAGLFTEVVKSDSRNFGFTGYGLTNGFTNETGITAGSAANANYIPVVSGGGSQNGLLSYFASVNYGYSGKYYLSLVGRRDGSSRYGVNNRFANFGSAGFTWDASAEKFMENVRFVNELKLRASIGTNGNNLTAAGDYPIPVFARTAYAGISGWSPSSPGNLDYKWETNRTINFGLDFMILNKRLSGTIEWYDRKTLDLYYSVPVDPSGGGFSSIPSNFGSLRNRGIELMLKGDVISNRNFTWTLEGNITYNKNRILNLPQDSVVSGVTILAKGRPVNSLFLVDYAGVNPANGNAQYYTKAKALTETYSANDKVIWGTSDAPWYGGISTTVRYKGLELSAQMNFFLKRYMYNNDRVNLTNPSYYTDNMSVDVLREWKQAGDITDVPRPTSSGGNSFQSSTTRFMEDASFWRLRNVMLAYSLPSSVLSHLKFRTARVFVQGQNLWSSFKFKSFDPEMTGASLTGAQYPALKQTTVGISLGF
ncbi:MAG: SusC/RagA family TonB-linked outer membrane protein [Chitinophagaceae bacterium]